MSLRRSMQWFVRAAILAVLVACAAGIWYAQTWVSAEQVQAAVEQALREQFPDSQIHIQSARLSVFGGVTVTDVRMTRPGDEEPFFAAPHALIAHDKEGLNHGRLTIRKIELDKPTFLIVRQANGEWQWPGLDRDGAADRPVPTLIVRDATVVVRDRSPGGLPEFRVEKAKFQFVNDPHAVLKIQGQAQLVPVGVVTVAAQFNRETKACAVRVELPDVTINADFAKELARFRPEASEWLAGIAANCVVKADIAYLPGSAKPLRSELQIDLRDGRFEDASLPWPAEAVNCRATLVDGKLTIDKGTAKFGPTTVELSLETLPLPMLCVDRIAKAGAAADAAVQGPVDPESKIATVTATLKNVPLGDELFSRLPPRAEAIRKAFQPNGTVDLTYRFSRTNAGWKRDLECRPNRLGIVCEQFRLPLHELDGTIRKTTTFDGAVESDEVNVRLTGSTGGKRIDVLGRVVGAGDDPFIDFRISGDDIALDSKLFDAIPQEKPRRLLQKLHATGRADFVATVSKDFGMNRTVSNVTVTVKDGAMNYDRFPYPLEGVSGKIAIKVVGSDAARPNAPGSYRQGDPNPDRVELVGFTGRHAGGQVWLDGTIEEASGSRDQVCTLKLKALNCPLDAAFVKSMEAIKLGEVHDTFRPTGAVTLGANVQITERHGAPVVNGEVEFDPDRDLILAVNFKGPTAKPRFFAYEMADTAGAFRFQKRKVELLDFSARHGASRLGFDFGEVRFRDDGAIWAQLGRLSATPLVADADLIAALPKPLQTPLASAKPTGPMDLQVRQLVVLLPTVAGAKAAEPEAIGTARSQMPSADSPKYADPTIYWDGQIKLAGASLDAGTAWTDLIGTVACRGRYDGDHLTGAVGNVWLESGSIFQQPLQKVKAGFVADPQLRGPGPLAAYAPIRVRVTDVQGRCFRGELGGEAQIVLADVPQFRLSLSAQGVRLEDLAAHHQLGKESELAGIAQGKIYIEHEPDPKTGLCRLQGSGSIDVPQGRLYKLPVLLELVKLAKLHAPDQTGFEEAHATFRLDGDRIHVDKIDLLGNAVSLGGTGELDRNAQDVKLEFYTIWSQTLKRWLTTPLGDPTSALSEQLFRIDAVRTNGGEFTYSPRMVPAITDPFRAVADRVKQRMGLTPDPVIRATGGR